MVLSNDGAAHDWFLDFNNNFQLGPIHSPDFNSRTVWTNFTFTAVLNQSRGFPHGGTFTYRCEYHPFSMFGNFEFLDRKSTRLNSSHITISYAVFCLKKKKQNKAIQLL